MTAIQLDMADVARDQQALHAWLRAHDLDPKRTRPGVIVREHRIAATLYVLDERGRHQPKRDPFTDEFLGAITEDVDLPLRTPVPAGLGTVIE